MLHALMPVQPDCSLDVACPCRVRDRVQMRKRAVAARFASIVADRSRQRDDLEHRVVIASRESPISLDMPPGIADKNPMNFGRTHLASCGARAALVLLLSVTTTIAPSSAHAAC